MRIHPIIRLVRLPLAITALGDAWAGFHLVRGDLGSGPAAYLALVLGASVCLYLGGMAWNDIFDRRRDRELHPGRPLPSGELSVVEATTTAVLLSALGLGLAFAAGHRPGFVALGILGCILAYDAGGKAIPLVGAALMAGCRGLDLVLGMAVAPLPGPGPDWLPVGVLFIHVLALTRISELEEEPPGPLRANRLRVHLGLAVVGLVVLCARSHVLATGPAALLFLVGAPAATRAFGGGPAAVGRLVGVLVRGILLVEAAILCGAGRPRAGAVLVLLWAVASVLGRRSSRWRRAAGLPAADG